jgi:dolichol kinase
MHNETGIIGSRARVKKTGCEDASLAREMIRKGIHLMLLAIPLSYAYLSRVQLVIILAGLSAVSIAIDVGRMVSASVDRLFRRVVGTLLRPHETRRITGATWILISSFLCVLFFDRWIAQSVLLWAIVSDALSAIVGKAWGRYRISGGKTIEGCAAFVFTSLVLLAFVQDKNWIIGIAGIGVASISEIVITIVDDNLTIPLLSGCVMQLLSGLV